MPVLDHVGYLLLIPSKKTSNLFFFYLNKQLGLEPKPHLPQIGSPQKNQKNRGQVRRKDHVLRFE
ncbi:MAG: hypothetical protein CVU43_03730 [Chloroflexi bacterium HGW-Chloroflexi-5]|nr:MAG: hypothetical protein CVU43_03730 [Chloroflexi bacterium HGW-Chloroflexi-5]